MDLTSRIADAKNVFSLRYILNKYPIELKAEYNRVAFQRQLNHFKNYFKWGGDSFLQKVVKGIQFDFEAEVLEGKHREPPPPPTIEEYTYEEFQNEEIEFVSSMELKIPPTQSGSILRDVELMAIKEILIQEGWNRTKAAKRLGVSIRTLRNKLTAYDKAGFFKREYERVKVQKVKPIKTRQIPRSPYKIDEPIKCPVVEDEKKIHERIVQHREMMRERRKEKEKVEETKPEPQVVMAKCCPTKLVWLDDLCLTCYKQRKKNLSYKGKHP